MSRDDAEFWVLAAAMLIVAVLSWQWAMSHSVRERLAGTEIEQMKE